MPATRITPRRSGSTASSSLGSLPHRALALVVEWAALHREELLGNWERARREEPARADRPAAVRCGCGPDGRHHGSRCPR
ncbi:DUF4160 domain-containing protein [Gaiella occulta]|uniref:DUF4160 domain-containing protein n=1 Tax=Gaiella occulta TaxID=1002870 RepID=UPI003BEEBD72